MIVQAGQSEDGRGLAAATAEVIFTAHQHLATAQDFYRDIKARAAGVGRDPSHVLIMPGVAPFVGRTEAEARSKSTSSSTTSSSPQDGVALLNALTGGNARLARAIDLDGPLPPTPPTEGMKSRQALIRQIADENGFTIRQLYQWIATARGHYTIVGSATQVADSCRSGSRTRPRTASTSCRPGCRRALDDFVDLVIPELQRRGLFRTAYEGRTLRENLGLPYPVNRWAAARALEPAAE